MISTRIAIAGLGAIGKAVARRLTDGLPGLQLAAIATGNAATARDWLKEQNIDCPVVELGLPGQTMHKVDERVAVADVTGLAGLYAAFIGAYLKPAP